MIALLIVIAWMIPTLVTFRYTGYVNNEAIVNGPHEGAVLCSSCKCVTCGFPREKHSALYRGLPTCSKSYSDREGWEGMHLTAVLFGLVEALLWPLTLMVFGSKLLVKSAGISMTYFKPPPEIRSREERRAVRDAAKDERMRTLEKRNKQLEKELGIG